MHALQNTEKNEEKEVEQYRKSENAKDHKIEQEINEFNSKKHQYQTREHELLSSHYFLIIIMIKYVCYPNIQRKTT